MPVADIRNLNPARHAERILAAWAAGNEPLLHQELQKSHQLAGTPGRGLDEERRELLLAASEGILRSPGPLVSGRQDPSVRRCLDLLAHLAQAPSLTPGRN